MAKIASKPKAPAKAAPTRPTQRSYQFDNGGSMTADWGKITPPSVGFVEAQQSAARQQSAAANPANDPLARVEIKLSDGGTRNPALKAGLENLRAMSQAEADENALARRFRAAENAKAREIQQDQLNKEYSLGREQNAINRRQVDNDNFYQSNTSRISAFNAQVEADYKQKSLEGELSIANRKLDQQQRQFDEGMSRSFLDNVLEQGLDWSKANLTSETAKYGHDAATRQAKLQSQGMVESEKLRADAARYAADREYQGRVQSSVLGNMSIQNQNWGQMLSSFLSR